jgi:hypothetical protein
MMPRLQQANDFGDSQFPQLADVFRSIDLGVAAIVASDPSQPPRLVLKRRQRIVRSTVTVERRRLSRRQAACGSGFSDSHRIGHE